MSHGESSATCDYDVNNKMISLINDRYHAYFKHRYRRIRAALKHVPCIRRENTLITAA